MADKLIYDGLRDAFPDVHIATDEQAETHDQAVSDFFIVDSQDSTKEFIHRRDEFTVNIAWVEQGEPRLGVVFAPARERLFYTNESGQAVEELGAHDAEAVGDHKKMNVSNPDASALVVVASKSHRDVATDEYINRYQVVNTRSAGSSLKFYLLVSRVRPIFVRALGEQWTGIQPQGKRFWKEQEAGCPSRRSDTAELR